MTPTRAGPSRMIDNMLEAFLEEHADLAPSEQRRADHASYTPGEDLLGPLSGRSSGSDNPATGLSSQPRQVASIRTPSLSRARSASSRMSPAATPVAAISRGPAVPSIRNHEEVEEVPRLPREVRRAVTSSVLRPVISEPRSVTPYSVLSPLYSPPTSPHAAGQHYGHSYYSSQPISVNNYTVHNHCKSELPTQDCTNFTHTVLLRLQSNTLLVFAYSACPKLWRCCQRRGPGCCGHYITSGLGGQPSTNTILVSRLHRSRHPFRFLTRCSVGMIPGAASGATKEGPAPGSCEPVCA